jgi:hypothetical protein
MLLYLFIQYDINFKYQISLRFGFNSKIANYTIHSIMKSIEKELPTKKKNYTGIFQLYSMQRIFVSFV